MSPTKAPPSKAMQELLVMQMRAALTVVHALNAEDLEAWVDAAEHADTMGPFLDPTLWIAAHDDLRLMIDHARLLLKLRKALPA